jgi:hypothetical protein
MKPSETCASARPASISSALTAAARAGGTAVRGGKCKKPALNV